MSGRPSNASPARSRQKRRRASSSVVPVLFAMAAIASGISSMYPSSLVPSPPHFSEPRYRTIVEVLGVYRLWLFPCRLSFRECDLERLSGKCSAGVRMAYALHYGEQEILYGSVLRRMALHQPASARSHRTGQGRPRLHGLRAVLDAVFYVLKSGCPWRLLPKDFPPWKTVYDWFRRWRL